MAGTSPSRRRRQPSAEEVKTTPYRPNYSTEDVETDSPGSPFRASYTSTGSAGAGAESGTPAVRKAKRDLNIFRKKELAVIRLQAAYRGKCARQKAAAQAANPTVKSAAEFRSNLEPYIATAFATTIAVQWDTTIDILLAANESKAGFSFVTALATTLYVALLYYALSFLKKGFNARLLNLIKQALQILVGWMWKATVTSIDDYIANQALLFSRDTEIWIQFGYMAGWSIFIAPVFTGVIVLLMHPSRHGKEGFWRQFSGLLLGAEALMVGYSWHQTISHLSLAIVTPSQANIPAGESALLMAAILRALSIQMVVGLLKAKTPLNNVAVKVYKGPKLEDTLSHSFWDCSLFVGAKTLSFVCAFSWWAIVQRLAKHSAIGADGWGAYIIYTIFAFVYLFIACALAGLGAPRAVCCGGMKWLAQSELLYYSTVAIQLGWGVQNSYQTLIEKLEDRDSRQSIVAIALGACSMLILLLVIIFLLIFGGIRRTAKQERDLAQL